MAAVVEALPTRLEASRISTDDSMLLDEGNASAFEMTQLVSGPDSCRPAAKDHYMRVRQSACLVKSPIGSVGSRQLS